MKNLNHPVAICGLICIACVAYLTVAMLEGCAPSQVEQNAKFAVRIGECDVQKTCAAYVRCRQDLAAETHRMFTGHCEVLDGGSHE